VSFGSPRISPDGKQVALAISTEGEGQNIWIYDFEGGSLHRLTFEGGSVETWSPDGTWIIFQRGRDERGQRGISRQLADGSGPVEQREDIEKLKARLEQVLTAQQTLAAVTQ
jgi:Tol biopolymer transport system component